MTREAAQAEPSQGQRIAIFVATSGHSGVDRIINNLVAQFDRWGNPVDLLQIQGHGPKVSVHGLRHARRIALGASHVNTALPALIRYLRRERPVALLTDKDRVNRIAIIARALAGSDTRLVVRLGTTVSANLADRGALERWTQRSSMRNLYPLADRVILPSEDAANDLIAYTGLAPTQIQVVRSPVVSEQIDELAADPVDHPWFRAGEPPVVLGVGELGYRKDFTTLIRAFAEVRRARPCRLMILGRGRRKDALVALASELGVSNDVALPGFVTNPYPIMSRSSLYVLSSRWEGMPVALIEALACGTPVVATDCPSGPREVLGNTEASSLVPVGAVSAMAAAITVQLDHPSEPANLRRLVEPYRIPASAAAYLRVLGIETPALAGLSS
jgi:glycosyltransferase involved in cell wall biosynthesis